MDRIAVAIIVFLVLFAIFAVVYGALSIYGGSQCLKYGWANGKVGLDTTIYCVRFEGATQVVRPLSEIQAEK